MPKKLNDIQFADLLPESIKNDSTITSAAQALDGEIQAVNSELEKPLLYARLEELPEPIVDHLAWQLHVDAWYPDMPLTNKRKLIKESIAWHRYLGTPYAVKTVAEAIMGPTRISEWYEYGGDPYYFRVYVDLEDRGLSQDEQDRGVAAVMATKNVRSHLDLLRIYLTNRSETPDIGACALSGEIGAVYPYNLTELEQYDDVPARAIGSHYIDTTTIYPQ